MYCNYHRTEQYRMRYCACV